MGSYLVEHADRGHAVSSIVIATRAWFGTIGATFLLEVLWRALRNPATGVPTAEWSDGALVATLVLVVSWHFGREQDVTLIGLLFAGILWALLTIGFEAMYRMYATDHYAIRLLMMLFLGDYRGANDWLLRLFIAVQLVGPLFTGTVRGVLTHWTADHELHYR